MNTHMQPYLLSRHIIEIEESHHRHLAFDEYITYHRKKLLKF